MSDHLQKFINQNREAFDNKEPSDLVWLNIQKHLDQEKGRQHRIYPIIMRIAAVFVGVLAVGILIGLNINKGSNDTIDYAMSPQMKEFQKSEQHYIQRVSNAKTELAKFGAQDEASYDIAELEAVFEELKAELLTTDYQNKETILNAMIENHKTKVEILERILERTKSNNISNTSTNEEAINI